MKKLFALLLLILPFCAHAIGTDSGIPRSFNQPESSLSIKNFPDFGLGSGKLGIKNNANTRLYTYRNTFQEPVQSNIAIDGTTLYFPLTESDPSTVYNNGSTISLSLVGSAGHITSGTNYFNANGKHIVLDGTAYLKGNAGIALRTQDIYVELDYYALFSGGGGISPVQLVGGGPAVLGNSAWGVYVYTDGSIYFFIKDSAGNLKYAYWVSTDGLYSGTWHRIKMQIDRDDTANRRCWVDGVELTNTFDSLSDASAEDITGTHFEIGATGFSAAYIHGGGIANVKVVYGTYTGSTTATFDKGLTPQTGISVPAFKRTTIQGGLLQQRNSTAPYLAKSFQGNPQKQNYDSTNILATGYLSESPATNVLIRNRELNNAAWTPSGSLAVTENATNGVDGVPKAERLVSSNTNQTLEQTTSERSTSKKVIFSCYFKAASGTFDQDDVLLELEDSAAGAEKVSGLLDADATGNATIGTTWKRAYIYNAFTSGVSGSIKARIKTVTNGLTYYVDACQVEKSGNSATIISRKPTSFINTSATTATRNLTEMTLDVSELSSKYSILMLWQPSFAYADLIGTLVPFSISTATTVTLPYVVAGGNWTYVYYNNSASIGAVTWVPYAWYCIGAVNDTDTDEFYSVFNSTLSTKQTITVSTPTHTYFRVGNDVTNVSGANGVITDLRVYRDKQLTQAQVTSECNAMKIAIGVTP